MLKKIDVPFVFTTKSRMDLQLTQSPLKIWDSYFNGDYSILPTRNA